MTGSPAEASSTTASVLLLLLLLCLALLLCSSCSALSSSSSFSWCFSGGLPNTCSVHSRPPGTARPQHKRKETKNNKRLVQAYASFLSLFPFPFSSRNLLLSSPRKDSPVFLFLVPRSSRQLLRISRKKNEKKGRDQERKRKRGRAWKSCLIGRPARTSSLLAS